MQAKLLSAAVAAAFIGAPAFAATPAFDTANTVEFYLSGATAQHGQLVNYMRRACVAGTLTSYEQSNQYAFHCQINTAVIPGVSKANMVVYKSGVGGSGNGTAPVANNATLQFMDVATISAAGCSAATTIAAVAAVAPDTIGLPAYDRKTCTQALVNKVTQAGLSDVEPKLFKGSVAGLDDTAIGKLTVKPTNQLIFGVPVTLGLYRALQTAQGLALDDTEANMPSLSKAQVTGIYTGSIITWDQLGLTNAADPYNAIWVARRVQTSGTQTSARVFFLNDPCVKDMAAFVADGDPAAITNPLACSSIDPLTDGYSTVFQGSGSSNVVTCLNDHQDDGRWAVGVLSTEYVTTAASKFRFVKVDGAAPTLEKAANGKYQYVMEATMQWANAGATTPLAGDGMTIATALSNGFNNGTVIAGINTGLVQVYGPAGILGAPSLANVASDPIDAAAVLVNPISAYTHSGSGSTNNCQPLQPSQSGSRTGI